MRSTIELSARGLRVVTGLAALLALLLVVIPAQADEIEPEPEQEPAAVAEPEPAPEPAAEPEPAPEPKPEPIAMPEEDDEGFARKGFYVGASIAGAWYTDAKDEVKDALPTITPPGQAAPRVDMEKPLGLGLRAGYRFLPRLAGEVQFEWFTSSNIELEGANNFRFNAVKVETLALNANLKGYLLTGRIQPFVLVGGGLLHANSKDRLNLNFNNNGDAFAARFFGGVDLYLNPKFVVVIEGGYVLPTGKLDNLENVVWSAGLNYRF